MSSLRVPSRWQEGWDELVKTFRRPLRRREMLEGLAFLAPSFLLLLVFVIIPIISAFLLGFMEWKYLSRDPRFIGLGNYDYLLRRPDLWRAIKNTLYFAVLKIPLDMVLALLIALLLNRGLRGQAFYRTVYFLPVITSTVAVSAVWRWIYDPQLGLANAALDVVGFPQQTWLSDPKLAMPAVALVALWKGLGYDIIIYLAGLQGIPETYYEAAKIDGASAWQQFRYVTWPLLSPVTYFVLIMSVINSFKVFGQVHVLTPQGGPLRSTEVLVLYVYRLAFQQFQFGRASATAVVLFIIVLSITVVQRRIIEPRVHHQ